MARIRSNASGASLTLLPRTTLGRDGGCDVTLADPRVSSRHAEIRWTPSGWLLRDLGSRNGTSLDGVRLRPGLTPRLRAGSLLAFGSSANAFVVEDTAPPRLPVAVSAQSGRRIEAAGGVLLLPDTERPIACVYREDEGWRCERGEEILSVRDEGLLAAGEEVFRIFLPIEHAPTAEAREPVELLQCALRFRVSLDEESVHLTAVAPDEEIDLGERVFHYLLLTLARRRRADQDAALPEAEAGWVYRDELMRMLALPRERLNHDIFRARRHLAAAGIDGASRLVERRQNTAQLRLGVAQIEILRG